MSKRFRLDPRTAASDNQGMSNQGTHMFFALANLTKSFNGAIGAGANLAVKGMMVGAFLDAASPKKPEAKLAVPAPKMSLIQRMF